MLSTNRKLVCIGTPSEHFIIQLLTEILKQQSKFLTYTQVYLGPLTLIALSFPNICTNSFTNC